MRLATILFGVAALATLGFVMTLGGRGAPTPREDEALRFLPVENGAVFDTMGAKVWKIRIPDGMLKGRERMTLKMLVNSRGLSRVLVSGPLRPDLRSGNTPTDVTVVLYLDSPDYASVKRLHVGLAWDKFSYRAAVGNPVEGFDGYSQPNDLGDLTKGVRLATLSSSKTGSRADFSIWLE